MPAKELPMNGAPLAQGLEYVSYDPPVSDAASLAGHLPEHGSKPGAMRADYVSSAVPTPLEPVSIATRSEDAPPLGAWLTTNRHDDNYLDPERPHVSPESQRSAGIARRPK